MHMKNLGTIQYLGKQTSQWKGRRLKVTAVGVNGLGVKKNKYSLQKIRN